MVEATQLSKKVIVESNMKLFNNKKKKTNS